MNDSLKQKAGLVYNVVESVILAMSVGLMIWLANIVIEHSNSLARQETRQESTDSRITRLESGGSDSVKVHIREDDTRFGLLQSRVEKLESAVILLQSTPGELKAINVRLDAMRDSQFRIEQAIGEHIKSNK